MNGTQRVDDSEVRVGDLIVFLGATHRVTDIETYDGLLDPSGELGWRIARESPTGWAITLIPGSSTEVVR